MIPPRRAAARRTKGVAGMGVQTCDYPNCEN